MPQILDVEQVVRKLSDIGWIRLGKITGDYQTLHCPFHSNGEEKKPSCGILLNAQYRGGISYPAGFFNCFACHASGDIYDFIRRLLEIHSTTSTVAQWLKDNIPGYEEETIEPLIPDNLSQAFQSSLAVKQIQSMTQKQQQFVSEEELASYRFVVPYMYERGLTDELIEKYDVGFDQHFVPPGRSRAVPSITFPVRDEQGRTLFCVRRSVKGKLYNYPTETVKPVYGVYEFPKDCKSAVLCESCINALTSVKYGFPALALLGTGNQFQIQQMRRLGLSEITLAFDGDEAGSRATSKWKKALSDIMVVWTIHMPDGKDLNDLTKEEFIQVYSERE